MPVDRHHGHGTMYGTRYTFGIVKSASNKIDKLAASSDHLNIEKDVLMTETWPQHKNDDSTVGVGRTDSVPDS